MPKYRPAPIRTTPFLVRSSRMPSVRRIKVFGILVSLFVITILFWTASLRQQREQDPRTVGDFYEKTINALDRDKNVDTGGADLGDQEIAKKLAASLKEAAQIAKDNTNAKAPKPDPPSDVVGVGSAAEGSRGDKSVAGRKKFSSGLSQQPVTEESAEDLEVEAELKLILKKAPIIIFSKSYCPHSRRAKDILLDKYIIDPTPFVVELDQHPLGAGLQANLAERTGRKTVPNVLINGVSIGGGDDVAELDSKGTLIDTVRDLGDVNIRDVKKRPVVDEAHGL